MKKLLLKMILPGVLVVPVGVLVACSNGSSSTNSNGGTNTQPSGNNSPGQTSNGENTTPPSGNNSQTKAKVSAYLPANNELLTNVILDANKYDTLKAKQLAFDEKSGDVYTFENKFLKFLFDKKAQDFLGVEGMKKLVNRAVLSLIITPNTHLNESDKISFEMVGIDDSNSDNAGAYTPGKIRVSIAKNIVDKDLDAAIDVYAAVINHEWGHFEMVDAINSLYGTNVFDLNMQSLWNDFRFGISTYKDLVNATDFSKWTSYSPAWYLEDSKIMFATPVRFFDLNADQEAFWKTNVTNEIQNASQMDGLGASDLNGSLAELATRIQLSYTFGLDSSEYLSTDYVTKMTIRNLLANQIEVSKYLNFDFFNPDNNQIAFDLMSSVLRNIYGIGKTSGVQVQYVQNGSAESLSGISFESIGMPYESQISSIVIKNAKDGSEINQLNVSHEEIPIGFNRNPFNPYEYKAVAHSSYVFDDQWGLPATKPEDITVELLDIKGNVIPDQKLKVTFARSLYEIYDLDSKAWVTKK